MALLTGQELADALDLDYDDPYEDALDQVAAAADDIVGTLITVGVEIFQARTASGGQAVAADFSPGPYRLSVWLTRRVMSLLGPYLNVKGMIG
jgi:methionine synthase II (cobalamin-independent)